LTHEVPTVGFLNRFRFDQRAVRSDLGKRDPFGFLKGNPVKLRLAPANEITCALRSELFSSKAKVVDGGTQSAAAARTVCSTKSLRLISILQLPKGHHNL